ncbi:MAG TPA: hypothetical protein VFK14_12360 [Solirubrobacterales bacterium]|nr:hypothetical protein [Solirubrobacterales bacterium]
MGENAIDMLAGLLEPVHTFPSDRLVVWAKNDGIALGSMVELETGIRFIDPHEDVDGGEIADLHRAFGRLYTALPLSEAERLWLFDPIKKRPWREGQPSIIEPTTLIGVTDEIVSAGLRQVIQGREVVRRLSDWRRETAEFAGQGTLDEARQALGDIATTLVTEANWPSEHEALREQLRA